MNWKWHWGFYAAGRMRNKSAAAALYFMCALQGNAMAKWTLKAK